MYGLKSFGRFLEGLALLSVAVTYWLEARRAASERTGEQIGLLKMILAEMNINEQILDRLIEEPQRLADETTQPVPRTVAWDRYQSRISQLLVAVPFFSSLEFYYRELRQIEVSMQLGIAGGDDAEKLRQQAQRCIELSRIVNGDIYSYVLRLQQSYEGPKLG